MNEHMTGGSDESKTELQGWSENAGSGKGGKDLFEWIHLDVVFKLPPSKNENEKTTKHTKFWTPKLYTSLRYLNVETAP
jgi:hypothetical protein